MVSLGQRIVWLYATLLKCWNEIPNRELITFTSGLRSCQNMSSLIAFLGINGFIILFFRVPLIFSSFIVKLLSHADPLFFCSPGAGSVGWFGWLFLGLIVAAVSTPVYFSKVYFSYYVYVSQVSRFHQSGWRKFIMAAIPPLVGSKVFSLRLCPNWL